MREDKLARLKGYLDQASALRAHLKSDPLSWARHRQIKEWQSARARRTHGDLLADARFGPAMAFFLSDLYTLKDLTRRDEAMKRVLPIATSFLPASGLAVVADALELDALTEELDAVTAAAAGADLDRLDRLEPGAALAYGEAWRRAARNEGRERQLELLLDLGDVLTDMVRDPFTPSALALMQTPAQMAGAGAIHRFLERGYRAFRQLGSQADRFLGLLGGREHRLMIALGASDDSLTVVPARDWPAERVTGRA